MPQKGIVENSLPSDLEIRYKRFSNCTQNTPSTHTNPPILSEAQPILAKIERFACSQSPQRPQAFEGRDTAVFYTIPTNNVEAIENDERFA